MEFLFKPCGSSHEMPSVHGTKNPCCWIEATTMPKEYHYEVQILCNDCNKRSEVFFHVFGHKCRHCNSYNTTRTG